MCQVFTQFSPVQFSSALRTRSQNNVPGFHTVQFSSVQFSSVIRTRSQNNVPGFHTVQFSSVLRTRSQTQ
jgi:hypothetical protein